MFICNRNANTSLRNPSTNVAPPVRNQYAHKGRLHLNKKLSKKNLLKEFSSCHGKGSYPTVELICTDFSKFILKHYYSILLTLRASLKRVCSTESNNVF